ncbi:hypothetical protein DFH08DRAFT_950936 [Mycena albidolilacea]|uniref:Uncharacterized protein n=1 Tax=Mycena albidolilacea TaxID=1033008 RepID=A0AAD7ALY8_9AGAR|nr:hypothetical protein DFH08DRAFT_950936 [Mycena albidolilacea]
MSQESIPCGSPLPLTGKEIYPLNLLSTSLHALKESAEAFPPLSSAVGGVLAVWEIAERAKHSKSAARDIALRTKDILDVIADAIPDGSIISPSILIRIERFTLLLNEIRCSMEAITLSSGVSRVMHLNRNEQVLRGINLRLDEAYRDFVTASVLCVEVQQIRPSDQQMHTLDGVHKIADATDTLTLDLSSVMFYIKISVFLAGP